MIASGEQITSVQIKSERQYLSALSLCSVVNATRGEDSTLLE